MLWNNFSVPRHGWHHVETFDCVDPDGDGSNTGEMQICEACAAREIRYVHVLRHAAWPHEVEVGCECAAQMTGEPDEIHKGRVASVKNRARRRANFPTHNGWTRTAKGQPKLKAHGRTYILKQSRYGAWAGSYLAEGGGWISVDGWHKNINDAKLALFDAADPVAPRPAAA